jgi:hypothetical protein
MMSAASVATLAKMLEALPDTAQERVVEHVREYIDELRDELQWDSQFGASQSKLSAAARKAREEIAQGLSTPMDVDKL